MAVNPSSRTSGARPNTGGRRFNTRRRKFTRNKKCQFCVDKTSHIDYKDMRKLRRFITERGKIIPKRVSGNCAKHQRKLTIALKRARNIALLPFSNR